MNKKQKICLSICLILTILVCFIILFVKNEFVSKFLSLFSVISAIVPTVINLISSDKDEKLRLQKIIEDANKFIIENNDEISYIPLCLVANALDNHHKYCRKIYNSFNILNDELKKEILKQLKFKYELFIDNKWIEDELKFIESFIEEHKLKDIFLCDDVVKYFHKALNCYSKDLYEYEYEDCFNLNCNNFECSDCDKKITFNMCLDSYLDNHSISTPLSIISRKYINANGKKICCLCMQIIFLLCSFLEEKLNKESVCSLTKLSTDDIEINTYEDRYLECLAELYNFHIVKKSCKDKKLISKFV